MISPLFESIIDYSWTRQSLRRARGTSIRTVIHNLIQDVKGLKPLLYLLIWVGALAVSYYLYKRQLGAIPFFVLSFYFFKLAKKEFLRQPEQDVKERRQSTRKKIEQIRK